jgi:hypothetical protein
MTLILNEVPDIPPPKADTSIESFNDFLRDAGNPPVNSELRQEEEAAGVPVREDKIPTLPVPKVATLDEHIDASKFETNPLREETPTEEVPKPAQPEPQKMSLLDKLLNPVEETPATPTPNAVPASTTEPPSGFFSQEQVNQMIVDARAEETLKYENLRIVQEEFQKDPYAFYAKHAPALVKDFDVTKYVDTELAKEFGEDFVVVQEDLAKFNSPSNKYLRRQTELEQKAMSYQDTAQHTEQSAGEEEKQKLYNLKQSIMKKYGVENEQSFDQNVWNQLGALTASDVYERLVEHSLLLKDIANKRENARKPVNRGFDTPSVLDVEGASNTVDDKAAGELSMLYSPERMNKTNIIR